MSGCEEQDPANAFTMYPLALNRVCGFDLDDIRVAKQLQLCAESGFGIDSA